MASSAELEEEEWLTDTAEMNTFSFMHCKGADNIESFLESDTYIPIRSNRLTDAECFADTTLTYDVDGVLIELESFNAIKTFRPYLNFLPYGKRSLIPVYHILRKHLPLSRYSSSAHQLLKSSVGMKLTGALGVSTMIALLPDFKCTSVDAANMKDVTFATLHHLPRLLVTQIRMLHGEDEVRPTFRKNVLWSKMTTLNLLQRDQHFVLNLLDEALTALTDDVPANMKLIRFDYQFGQRASSLELSQLYHMNLVSNLSIHWAVNVSFHNTHLLWARNGLAQECGTRGTYTTALSFFECCNFQSNLDGQLLDISRKLRAVINEDIGNISFVQLYADTPHLKFTKSCHPVSGIIACCGLLHPATNHVLQANAEKFITVMWNNIAQMTQHMKSRLEIVKVYSSGDYVFVPTDPAEAFDRSALEHFMTTSDVFVPFFDPDLKFMEGLNEVLQHLIQKLDQMNNDFKNSGSFWPTWIAYQTEMALQSVFSGKIDARASLRYAKYLGPGTMDSATTRRGFLSLAPANSCAQNERSHPPLELWIQNLTQLSRIKRLFGFNDCLGSSIEVIGELSIQIFLNDVCAISGKLPGSLLDEMKKNDPFPYVIKRVETPANLVVKLSNPKYSRFPSVFPRLLALLERANLGVTIHKVLLTGLVELGLVHFPSLGIFDGSRNEKFTWNRKDVVRLHIKSSGPPDAVQRSVELSCDVKDDIITQQLCYQSTVDLLPNILPWVHDVWRRLHRSVITEPQKRKVLLFVSCLALLQQSHSRPYVDFRRLKELQGQLPIRQEEMQTLTILSRTLNPFMNNPRVFRLHDDIHVSLPVEKEKTGSKKKKVPTATLR